MRLPVAVFAAMTACQPAASPPDEEPTDVFEPIGVGTLYEGIQIGEGGDGLPCAALLNPAEEATRPEELTSSAAFLNALDQTYNGLNYAISGSTGSFDVVQRPEAQAYLLTYSPLGTVDCPEPSWVAGVWVTLKGDQVNVDIPATAHSFPAIDWEWSGVVVGQDIGLADGLPEYIVRASPDGSALLGTIEEPDTTLVGGFGQ